MILGTPAAKDLSSLVVEQVAVPPDRTDAQLGDPSVPFKEQVAALTRRFGHSFVLYESCNSFWTRKCCTLSFKFYCIPLVWNVVA